MAVPLVVALLVALAPAAAGKAKAPPEQTAKRRVPVVPCERNTSEFRIEVIDAWDLSRPGPPSPNSKVLQPNVQVSLLLQQHFSDWTEAPEGKATFNFQTIFEFSPDVNLRGEIITFQVNQYRKILPSKVIGSGYIPLAHISSELISVNLPVIRGEQDNAGTLSVKYVMFDPLVCPVVSSTRWKEQKQITPIS